MRLTSTGFAAGTRTRARPAPRLALLAAALGAIMALDRRFGALPVQHLYYLPIIYAARQFGRAGGALVALVSIALYHLADPDLRSLRYGEADVVQVALFLTVALVTAKLVEDAERMRALAHTDDLTGLHNLRSFEAALKALVRAAALGRTPLALLALDVDRLKELNDTHGHLTGAEAVRTVGRLLAESVPGTAVACRYGGDEFVVAVPECDDARALDIAERVRARVERCAPTLAGVRFRPGSLSVSVGVTASIPPADARPEEAGEALFRAADGALYRAKARGRNRVSAHQAGHDTAHKRARSIDPTAQTAP